MIEDTVILVVDDDPDVLAMTALQLEAKGWVVETAESGQEALDKVRAEPGRYGVVVSDVVMPGMGGYELCVELKNNEETMLIPILFVSSRVSLEEKTKGYGVGVDDYISKPADIDELSMKVNRLVTNKSHGEQLNSQLAESQTVAMQAMTYSSDLGQVLEFYKNSIATKDFKALAELLFQFTGERGLRCTLQILTPQGVLNFGDRGEVSPLESNVIELSRTRGRFFDFGPRTVINYDDFSLLTKNMPVDDPERYGIFKDTLGTLCNAIEARVKFLLHEDSARQNEQIVSTVLGVLEDIHTTFSDIQQANMGVINQLSEALDEAMMDLGLTSHQEELVRELVDECRDNSSAVFTRSEVLYEKFDEVKGKLDAILNG
ncbi:MAG TPA: response regulator [Candidatus Tenderia sp.]|nr:response regulator [Candidatus Tenderia sp.]